VEVESEKYTTMGRGGTETTQENYPGSPCNIYEVV